MIPLPPMPTPALAASPALRAVGGVEATGTGGGQAGPGSSAQGTAHASDRQADLDRLLQQAGAAAFPERQVAVAMFHDAESGHDVCRVSDRDTGETLAQTPPEALLRFFASTRGATGSALVEVEA
ncbi:MAG: hypothetical protein U1E17_10840 [Geminicoccaceae bacterium]